MGGVNPVCALITFSTLLPVLPIVAFYSIYYGACDQVLAYLVQEPLSDSARGLVSAFTAVGVVNLIVAAFVVVAYTEKDPVQRSDPDTSKKED